MKKFYAYRLPLRNKIITLRAHTQLNTPFHNFTFLQTHLQTFRYAVTHSSFKNLQSFQKLKTLLDNQKGHSKALLQMQKIDFSQNDLIVIHQSKTTQERNQKKIFGKLKKQYQNSNQLDLNQFRQEGKIPNKYLIGSPKKNWNFINKLKSNIKSSLDFTSKYKLYNSQISPQLCSLLKEFSQTYIKAKHQFAANINRNNIREALKNASDLNFIHLEVNQKIFETIVTNYKNEPYQKRKQIINYLTQYKKKFYYSSKENSNEQNNNLSFKHYKFMIHGSHQRDLVNYNELIRAFDVPEDYVLFDENQTQLEQTKNNDINLFSTSQIMKQSVKSLQSKQNKNKNQKGIKKVSQQVKRKIMQKSLYQLKNNKNSQQNLSFINSYQHIEQQINKDDQKLKKSQQILQKLQFIYSKFSLIFKWSKVLDVNIYLVRKQLSGYQIYDIIRAMRQFANLPIQSYSQNNDEMHNENTARKIKQIALFRFLNIYTFFAYINIQDLQFQKIEDSIFKLLMDTYQIWDKNGEIKIQNINKDKFSNVPYQLISIWKSRGQLNTKIFFQFVQPILKELLEREIIQTRISLNSLVYNLVCSTMFFEQEIKIYPQKAEQIKEVQRKVIDFIIKLVQYSQTKRIKQNASMHLAKHYLIIKFNWETKWKKKQKCFLVSHTFNCKDKQNHRILKFLQKNQFKTLGKVNNCLKAKLQQKQNKQDIKKEIIYPNNQKNVVKSSYGDQRTLKDIQYNDVQRFFQIVLKQIISQKNILFNVQFCNYEIDCLIICKNFLLAIEIQGSHYNSNIKQEQFIQYDREVESSLLKLTQTGKQYMFKQMLDQNRKVIDDNLQQGKLKNGKKMLKQAILNHYNIRYLKIKCWGKQQNYYLKYKNYKKTGDYLIYRIEQFCQTQFYDLFQQEEQNQEQEK